jgi:hypothetical protein
MPSSYTGVDTHGWTISANLIDDADLAAPAAALWNVPDEAALDNCAYLATHGVSRTRPEARDIRRSGAQQGCAILGQERRIGRTRAAGLAAGERSGLGVSVVGDHSAARDRVARVHRGQARSGLGRRWKPRGIPRWQASPNAVRQAPPSSGWILQSICDHDRCIGNCRCLRGTTYAHRRWHRRRSVGPRRKDVRQRGG